jgi:hypothetical protein
MGGRRRRLASRLPGDAERKEANVSQRASRRGAVLIVVLGVLAVLALLATTFATLQATEKQVSRNYLDTVRAKVLAQSGAHDAESRLRDAFPFRTFEPGPPAWRFWGTSNDESKEPLPSDRIEDATNPSFVVEDEAAQDPTDPNVKPRLIRIDGKDRGYSGAQRSGSNALNGDQYALKVSDLSSRIFVNDGVDLGNDSSVSQNLKRILNVLGEVLQVKLLGDKLLAARPATGYRHAQDMLKAVNYDETLYNRFKDYVTVHAWVDPNVANPVPLSPQMAAMMKSLTGVRYERGNAGCRAGSLVSGVDANDKPVAPPGGLMACPSACSTLPHGSDNIKVFGLDSLNPQWIEIVPRAPVNVNGASREVLVALLSDLRGFFVANRRRNNPRWKGDLYLSFKQQNAFRPRPISTGDEYGFLMETYPIVGPGGTASDGVSAFELADEIIACRNRKNTKWNNYSVHPWAGAFKTWNQFNLFVDSLVWKIGKPAALLTDTRPLHFDYQEETDDPAGNGPLVASDVQKEYASQAIADVLKANFNPNLHLNETNPDANLFTIVDKTDLFVNSTEFAFLPTGHFEVESLGRILRPKDPKVTDVLLSADNTLVAQAKVTAVYKLYNLTRETNQRQFYAGELAARTGAFETNNNRSLEVGPEPDNGVFPGNLGAPGEPDNEWSGALTFPTIGSRHHSTPENRKNTLLRTRQIGNDPQFGAAMHVHFDLDCDAHHHPADRSEIARVALPNENVRNFPDCVGGVPAAIAGPYDPTLGTPSLPVRLCRSFRLQPGAGGTVSVPSLAPYLVSDLRNDGCYVERHSAPAYYNRNSTGIWDFGGPEQAHASGMVAFWIKPSYRPDLTGKVRAFWDLSRYHTPCAQNVNVWPFAIWYYPSNYQTGPAGVSESTGPKYWYNNQGQFQPSSLVFGSKQWHSSSSGNLPRAHEFGRLTVGLNHDGHPDCRPIPLKRSPLRAHAWTQITAAWTLNGRDASGTAASRFYVNGNPSYAQYSYTSMTGGWASGTDKMYFFNQHDGGEYNHIRLGATSVIADAAKATDGYKGNYSGDHTVDEFYVWKNAGDADPLTLWMRGRYYKPMDTAYGEGVFTSQALNLAAGVPLRRLPSASVSAAPPSLPASPTTLPVPVREVRILGLAWTWFGEPVIADPARANNRTDDPRNRTRQAENVGQFQVLYDHQTQAGSTLVLNDVGPRVQLGVKDGSVTYGPYDDDAFSAVRASNGTTPVIQDPAGARYFAQFRLANADFSTILLATPALDDVTVYWDDAQAHLLSYVFDGRAF